MLHVSRSAVAMWETSSQSPDYGTLSNISQMFNLPTDFIMGYGVFSKWDLIKKYYDDVSRQLIRLIPHTLVMPSFCDDKFLIAWLDTRLYYEPDEMQLIRWFNFAVKSIDIKEPSDDTSPEAEVKIEFTADFTALINAELMKEAVGAYGANHATTLLGNSDPPPQSSILDGLTPQQLARVRDFVAGMKAGE